MISLPLLLHEHIDSLSLLLLLWHSIFTWISIRIFQAIVIDAPVVLITGANPSVIIVIIELLFLDFKLPLRIALLLPLSVSCLIVFEEVVHLFGIDGILIDFVADDAVVVVYVLSHDLARHPLLRPP